MSAGRSVPPPGPAKRPYREILTEEIAQGLSELRRPALGLLLSGFEAGLALGFSVLLMATADTLLEGQLPPAVVRLLMANFYAVGFLFVVLGRSELFTEHTTLAVFPVLARRTSVGSLLRLWGLVYVGNLAGALAFARLVTILGPGMGIASPQAFTSIAASAIGHASATILLSAVLAGWLMGLLSWLIAASRDTVSQMLFVWIVTFTIGFPHLHHSILGTVEVAAGLFSSPQLGVSELGRFLLWTTLGNSVGGTVFVAVMKYSHVVRSLSNYGQADADVDAESSME